MKKTLLLFLLAIISLSPACKKSQHTDPCEGLAWLTAPTRVAIIFLDKETGENIILSKKIDASKITITPTVKATTDLTTSGSLSFLIEQSKKGVFNYTINIPDVGITTLSYTNEGKVTGIPCHPIDIIVGEPVIEGKTYKVERISTSFLITVRI